MYFVYGNSGRYIHGGALFGGGPLLGGSVIGGSTVLTSVESVMEEIDKEVEHALAIRIFERKALAGVDCYTC